MKKLLFIFILLTIAYVLFSGKFQGDEKIALKDNELENVERYLRANIKTLSPVPEVLGGSWYVVTFDVDISANTGTVLYEDGHIQEDRTFSYITGDDNGVVSMEIR